jgi:hypothetical protein
MASTEDSTRRVRTAPPPRRDSTGSGTAVRTRTQPAKRRISKRPVTVRRVDPFSVLKLSLIFYFCTLLVFMLGIAVFWSVVNRLGIIDQGLAILADINLDVTINSGNIARALFLVGLLNVVLFSGINVFLAFLYNLVADLLGGLRLTLAEEERD